MPHHAVELDPGSRCSLLPGLGSGLPGLRSGLSGMRSYLPGLRTDLPGSSAPLSGRHVPPLRRQSGLLPRGQDRRRLEINFSGHNAGVRQNAVVPHSTTAGHRTVEASARRAARSDTLVARPAGLGHSRAAAPASETADQDVSSGLRGPRDRQDFGGGPGAGGLPDALASHSTTSVPHKTATALAPRSARSGPLDARPAEHGPSRSRTAASASEPTEQDYSSGLGSPCNWRPFEKKKFRAGCRRSAG